MRYFLNWITLDPGDVFIQVVEPVNIADVVVGCNETARLLSSVIRFFGSQDLEAGGCVRCCAERLSASPRQDNIAF